MDGSIDGWGMDRWIDSWMAGRWMDTIRDPTVRATARGGGSTARHRERDRQTDVQREIEIGYWTHCASHGGRRRRAAAAAAARRPDLIPHGSRRKRAWSGPAGHGAARRDQAQGTRAGPAPPVRADGLRRCVRSAVRDGVRGPRRMPLRTSRRKGRLSMILFRRGRRAHAGRIRVGRVRAGGTGACP